MLAARLPSKVGPRPQQLRRPRLHAQLPRLPRSVVVHVVERERSPRAKHEQPDPAVGPAPQPSLPYGEALLQREYELWQRQTEMLDRLQRQHEEDRRHWEQDRSSWAAHEARLQQELAELRSQLLFVLTKLGDVPRVMSGSSSGGSAASYTPSVRQQQLASSAFSEPAGLPPTLVVGSDDIYWVNQLHTGLVEAGYYPGDDDFEDFFFGESTQSALLTMQACEGLAETGVADEATWVKLLGPELTPFPSGGSEAGAAGEASSPAVAPGASADAKPFEQLFSLAFTETVEGSPGGEVRDAQRLEVTAATLAPVAGDASWEVVEEERLQAEAEAVAGAGGEVAVHGSASVQARHLEQGQQQLFTEWPVLFEGDGGRAVHGMQVALIQEGYYPDEDEMRWWNFGSSTLAALKTFQACSGRPESGVCDTGTWQALLGPGASPADIVSLRSEDSELEKDLTEQSDRVWLIGEQRWENRRRLRK